MVVQKKRVLSTIIWYAQSWHDSLHEEIYVEKSTFIGVINNEGDKKNETYMENLKRLETFVMLKYTLVRKGNIKNLAVVYFH